MKRKIVMTLCAAACIAMLFGCGKKETPVTEEVSAETVETPEEETPDEILPEEETEPGTDDTETSDEETGTVTGDDNNAQESGEKESYTADEMIDMLSQPNKDIVYAVQRGDLFYPLQETTHTVNVEETNGNRLVAVDDYITIPTVNYAQGEALVVFRDVNYGSFDISKVLDTSEHYCIPILFMASNNGECITAYSITSETSDTFLDGAYDFIYANSTLKYTEYDGNLVPEDSINNMFYLMEGEKDEIKELGGYEGSMYKSVQLKCMARYYETAPVGSFAGQTQPTKNGYEILSDSSVNPLEEGIYTMSTTAWCAFEIINE